MIGKLAIAGCKNTSVDLINGLLDLGFQVDTVITISPEKAESQSVAGYVDLRPFLEEKGIHVYTAHKYSLQSEEDERAIKELKIDVLLCMGWQRLIPEWFLSSLGVGAFGMHGSNKPLPHGRGRSPMNWSLIQNKKMFFTHLFQYKPGVDDGDIVGYQLFDITVFDNAHTMHLKNLTAMLKLLERELPILLNGSVNTYPQKDVEPSFYPKRTEEDGIIFWEDSSEDIYNLCRAVTRPFPGAFSFYKSTKIRIWKCVPFDSHLRWDHAEVGEICLVFLDGSFIIKTGDLSILVTEYDKPADLDLRKGMRLDSNGIKRKQWNNLPI